VISEGVAKFHLTFVLDKAGAHNRTQAVARARQQGLL
jgi:DNA-binding CsgD family transcriptional regulator